MTSWLRPRRAESDRMTPLVAFSALVTAVAARPGHRPGRRATVPAGAAPPGSVARERFARPELDEAEHPDRSSTRCGARHSPAMRS